MPVVTHFNDIEYVSTKLCGFAKFPTAAEIDESIENTTYSDKKKYLEFLKHCIAYANLKVTRLCFLQKCKFAIDDDDVLKLCTGNNFHNLYLLWHLENLKRGEITVFKRTITRKGVGGTIEVFYMDNSSPQKKCIVQKEWSLFNKLDSIRAQIKKNPDCELFNHCKATYGELFTSMYNFKVATTTTTTATTTTTTTITSTTTTTTTTTTTATTAAATATTTSNM